MVKNNTKIKKYLDVFVPSGIGVILYTFFSALVIILHQFDAIKQYLELPSDFQFAQIVMDWLDRMLTSSLGQGRTEMFVVGLFWAVVGLVVYLLLGAVARFFTELSEGLDERRYLWPQGTDRNLRLKEVTQRIVFRVTAFIGLLLVIFIPLANLVSRPTEAGTLGSQSPLQLVVWFAAIWVTLHICVILLRLMLLRPRLLN